MLNLESGIAYLKLTNSDEVAIVDAIYEDDLIALGPWRLHIEGYVEMGGSTRRGTCFLHKLVMQIFGHDLAGLEVDHRDRNKLDNRRRNLRVATHRQNSLNRGLRSDSRTGFKGVNWHKSKSKWRAYISIDGRNIHLGYFTDPIEAAKAYDKAALEGPDAEFHVLNFPIDKSAA